MTAKELQDKCLALQRACNDKQWELRKQYALEHNPVEVGDIVTDDYHTIKVEKFGMYGTPIPCMRYIGIELTKNGKPKKWQPVTGNHVLQCNMKSINGQPYKYVIEKE